MNYGELKAMVANYLHRSDLATTIPTFITLAQARINSSLKHLVLNTSGTIEATAATAAITLPSGCLHINRIRAPYAGSYRPLEQQTLAQNAAQVESRNGRTGDPEAYAMVSATTAELCPAPTDATTLLIDYRTKLVAFATEEATDVVLTDYPNIYLYATLIEATPFINNDKRLKMWVDLYEKAITDLEDADFELAWSDDLKMMKNPYIDIV